MKKSMFATQNNSLYHEYVKIILSITLGVLFLILANGGIKIGYTTQVSYLPQVYRILDPTFLQNDFTINSRLTHHFQFNYVTAQLFKIFGEKNGIITLNSLLLFFFSYSVFIFANFFELNKVNYILLMLLLSSSISEIGAGLEVSKIVGEPIASPSILAYGLALLVFVNIFKEKYYTVIILMSLALDFHLQIGACLIAINSLILLKRKKLFKVLRVKMLLLFILLSLPALFSIFEISKGEILSNWKYNSYLFRLGHHLHIRSALAFSAITVYFLIQLFFCRRYFSKNDTTKCKFNFVNDINLAIIFLCIIHFLDLYIFKTTYVLKLCLIRMSPFISFFGAVSLLYFLQNNLHSFFNKKLSRLFAFTLIGTVYFNKLHSDGALRYLSQNGFITEYSKINNPWTDMCTWIKNNSPANERYITSPANEGFSYFSHRENIVEFKQPALRGEFIDSWEERLFDLARIDFSRIENIVDLNDNYSREKFNIINNNFNQLNENELILISKKYQAPYAVLSIKHVDSFEIIYSNSAYKLVKVL